MNIRILMSSQTGVRDHLVDMAIESYIEWRERSTVVDEAYQNWLRASRSRRPLAFAAYQAALDQEEAAASDYASAIEAVELRFNPDR